MASFSKATVVQQASNDGPVKVYRGDVSPEWTIGAVPQGGYVLATVLESCLKHQSLTAHPDLIHVSAHYLRTTSIGPFEVHLRTLKAGRGFSNLVADLIQNEHTNVTAHLIFGVLAPSPTDPGYRLAPPSPYARRIPLSAHPSTFSRPSSAPNQIGFASHVMLTSDPDIWARNKPDSPTRTDSTTIGGGGLEWGGWAEFLEEEDIITTPALALLCDVFINPPSLLPGGKLGQSWNPTMVFNIEFKFPLQLLSSDHSNRTVALYSCGRFFNDPQGRHDVALEVWTAPSAIGQGEPSEGWRDKQVCLAVSTQMALTFPMEFNYQRQPKL